LETHKRVSSKVDIWQCSALYVGAALYDDLFVS
jgi:hypothetical protein